MLIGSIIPFNWMLAQDSQTIKSRIDEVTVFLNSAQVTRLASANINAGSNTIVLSGIEKSIDPNSIQVQGNNDFTIVSVAHEVNYINKLEEPPRITKIKEQLDDEEFKLELRKRLKQVYTSEKEMLKTNQDIGGSNAGVIIEDLMEMAEYYRKRMKELEIKLLDIDIEQKQIKKTIKTLKLQLNQLSNESKKTSSDIILNLSSSRRTQANLKITYITRNASWQPQYDIRSTDVNAPITLIHKGRIYQNTGNDWTNVRLKISTGNPTRRHTKPTLNQWKLDYFRQTTSHYAGTQIKRGRKSANNPELDEVQISAADDEMEFNSARSLSEQISFDRNLVTNEFVVGSRQTIKSGKVAKVVELQSSQIDAEFEYASVPKLDRSAFLVARIPNWQNLNLLPGRASLYFKGTFVGRTHINTANTSDTITISLGHDKEIIVDWKKVSDFSRKQIIGNKVKQVVKIEITLRNNKRQNISLNLEDQIPVSNQKDIEVELINSQNGKLDPKTGKINWNINLATGSSQTITLEYSVRYPSGKKIINW